jgi:DNA-binding transcriptional LysR family regulator
VAELERALGVSLMHRTTRRLQLSAAGAAYAERCAEIARIAAEANRAVSEAHETPTGTLRVTADPVFGEAFLGELVLDYARRWPEVRLDVVFTRRRIDLVEEGFDIAFRIGEVDDQSLTGLRLGPARIRYCAGPAYVAKRGAPATPAELERHDCIVVSSDGTPSRWPFAGKKGLSMVPVAGRLTLTSFAMARDAAIAGLSAAARGCHFGDALPREDGRGDELARDRDAVRHARATAADPATRVNRAFAVARASGPGAGLLLLDESVRDEPYAHLVRGALLEELGRDEEAIAALELATAHARNAHEAGQVRERIRALRRREQS